MKERGKQDVISVGGDAEMRMLRGGPARQKLCLALCLIEQEAAERGNKTCMDEREQGSGGARSRRRAGEGAQIHDMHEMVAPPALFIKTEQENANHETKHLNQGNTNGQLKT